MSDARHLDATTNELSLRHHERQALKVAGQCPPMRAVKKGKQPRAGKPLYL